MDEIKSNESGRQSSLWSQRNVYLLSFTGTLDFPRPLNKVSLETTDFTEETAIQELHLRAWALAHLSTPESIPEVHSDGSVKESGSSAENWDEDLSDPDEPVQQLDPNFKTLLKGFIDNKNAKGTVLTTVPTQWDIRTERSETSTQDDLKIPLLASSLFGRTEITAGEFRQWIASILKKASRRTPRILDPEDVQLLPLDIFLDPPTFSLWSSHALHNMRLAAIGVSRGIFSFSQLIKLVNDFFVQLKTSRDSIKSMVWTDEEAHVSAKCIDLFTRIIEIDGCVSKTVDKPLMHLEILLDIFPDHKKDWKLLELRLRAHKDPSKYFEPILQFFLEHQEPFALVSCCEMISQLSPLNGMPVSNPVRLNLDLLNELKDTFSRLKLLQIALDCLHGEERARAAAALSRMHLYEIPEIKMSLQFAIEALMGLEHDDVLLNGLAQSYLLLLGELCRLEEMKVSAECFQSACDLFELQHAKFFYDLGQKIVEVDLEQGQWLRAIEYLPKLLEKCKEENKVNEVVFLSIEYSKALEKVCKPSESEDQLLTALSVAENDVHSKDEIVLKIAQLYLSECLFLEAADMFGMLLTSQNGKRPLVLILLMKSLVEALKSFGGRKLEERALEVYEKIKKESKENSAFDSVLRTVEFVEAEIALLEWNNGYKEAAAMIEKHVAIQSKNAAKFNWMKGKRIANHFKRTANPQVLPQTHDTAVLIIQALTCAYEKASRMDSTIVPDILLDISDFYISCIFPSVIHGTHSVESMLRWIHPEDPSRALDRVERPLRKALDGTASSFSAISHIRALLCYSQLKLLQNDSETALTFFNHARDFFNDLFLHNSSVQDIEAFSIDFRDLILSISSKLCETLIAFDAFVLDTNYSVLEAHLFLHTDLRTLSNERCLGDDSDDEDSVGRSKSTSASDNDSWDDNVSSSSHSPLEKTERDKWSKRLTIFRGSKVAKSQRQMIRKRFVSLDPSNEVSVRQAVQYNLQSIWSLVHSITDVSENTQHSQWKLKQLLKEQSRLRYIRSMQWNDSDRIRYYETSVKSTSHPRDTRASLLWPNFIMIFLENGFVYVFSPSTKRKVALPWKTAQNDLMQLVMGLRMISSVDVDFGYSLTDLKEHKWSNQIDTSYTRCVLPFSSVSAEDDLKVPKLAQTSLQALLSTLDAQNVLLLISALLSECRIIVRYRDYDRMVKAIEAVVALIHPFRWQHLFLSSICNDAMSFLDISVPYIIAIDWTQSLSLSELKGNKILVDFTDNSVHWDTQSSLRPFVAIPDAYRLRILEALYKFEGHESIESSKRKTGRSRIEKFRSEKVFKWQRKALGSYGNESESGSVAVLQDSLIQIFAGLFCRYRLFLDTTAKPPFDVNDFLRHVRADRQAFMYMMVTRKCFEVFLKSRIDAKSAGVDASTFEHYVLRSISKMYAFIRKNDATGFSGVAQLAEGSQWKRRVFELNGNILTVSKRRRYKLLVLETIEIGPGSFLLQSELDEQQRHYIVLIPDLSDHSNMRIRIDNEVQCIEWINVLRSRILPTKIRKAYAALAKRINRTESMSV